MRLLVLVRSLSPRELPRRKRRLRPDRDSLVEYLTPVEYEQDADERELFKQASLGRVLPLLLELDQDTEFALCHDVARHRLGHDPGPADLPF